MQYKKIEYKSTCGMISKPFIYYAQLCKSNFDAFYNFLTYIMKCTMKRIMKFLPSRYDN